MMLNLMPDLTVVRNADSNAIVIGVSQWQR